MIFLVEFGIDKHSQIFQRLQFFVVFEKFARVYLFQIALEIIWLPIHIIYFRNICLVSLAKFRLNATGRVHKRERFQSCMHIPDIESFMYLYRVMLESKW